ncbi:response regulator transcription factor [Actinomadura formosensis]|uniref:response regulator transcription factor n=1 Tax=Actinomadura formosensis TaxID=60706 RepID=UPI0008322EE4|nr:response regulator transcription factor [Actinomadura formosensis]
MRRILIAEDEARAAAFVEKGLQGAGYSATVAEDGLAAYQFARTGYYDLMILDIGLPVRDGFTVLRQLREARVTLPIIILTARDSVGDTVAGLQGGADDYVSKPFAFEELLARVRLRLRLRGESAPEVTVLQAGDLTLDLLTRRMYVDGTAVELSSREFGMAEVFLRNPGRVLTREQLLSAVWGFDFDPGSNLVAVYVKNLRRKIGHQRVETIRGAGYRLNA